MAIYTPSMSYDHLIQLVAGPMEPHTLQIGAAIASGESFNAGSCVSLNTSGEVIAGCPNPSMPLWAINGSADLDVRTEGSTYGGGQNINGGNINCYVASGGYELFTSEYDTATGLNYYPNTLLTPSTGADVGLITEAADQTGIATELLCGVVSRGVIADQYSKNVLYFWPVYIPALAAT